MSGAWKQVWRWCGVPALLAAHATAHRSLLPAYARARARRCLGAFCSLVITHGILRFGVMFPCRPTCRPFRVLRENTVVPFRPVAKFRLLWLRATQIAPWRLHRRPQARLHPPGSREKLHVAQNGVGMGWSLTPRPTSPPDATKGAHECHRHEMDDQATIPRRLSAWPQTWAPSVMRAFRPQLQPPHRPCPAALGMLMTLWTP